MIVAADVNPDGSGRPSPVILRVYELKSLAGFNAANFFSLLERDKEVLGADGLAREELPLKPGETRAIKRTLQGETRYLGVTAAFRELERARWRAAVAVPPNKTTPVEIRLDGNDVSISAR